MSRILVVSNPAAARHHPNVLRTVRTVLQSEGCVVEVAGTDGPGHAAHLAQKGIRDGVDVVAVYGGDGTIMQVVEGIVGSQTPLGIIPGGTGNLLAGNLRVSRNPRKAALTVARGHTRRIDLGRLDTPEGVRYFAVACGAGYDAEIMAGTSGHAKRRWGMVAYVRRVVGTAHRVAPDSYRITVDGKESAVDAATVLVANCREIIPPILALGPDVAVDDGFLNVVALKARGFFESAAVVWSLWRQHPGNDAIRRIRGRVVRVEADRPRPVQLDGEIAGHTPFTATVLPKALTVVVP